MTTTNRTQHNDLNGAGIGLRRDLLNTLSDAPKQIAFMEIAPENWINVDTILKQRLHHFTERYPFVCHGLSLSLGGPDPLDKKLLSDIKQFLKIHNIQCYSEHLSYCASDGHLYDLMPIPFTEEAVHYVASRIREVQDFLEQSIAIENVSAYVALSDEMDEIEFITRILDEADCKLLLDVNNIYVNSNNFQFDPYEYLTKIPSQRIAYCHIAGHEKRNQQMIVDTHGADIINPVWDLLDKTYERHGVFPTLLERDFNFPEIESLLNEIQHIHKLQDKWQSTNAA